MFKHNTKRKQSPLGITQDLHGLTFAGCESLQPPVISVSVASTSAAFIPSAARSTTTEFAGFLERAALWAHYLIGGGDRSCARADWRGN